jgi:hypothetical protein
VWTDADSTSQVRGEVEYVGTGEKRLFLDYTALQSLLETWHHDLEAVS